MHRIAVVLFLSAVTACGGQPSTQQTVSVELGNESLALALADKLHDAGIRFHRQDDTTFVLPYPLPQDIERFLNKKMSEILPVGRSMTVDPQIRAEVYEEMANEGIAYRIVSFDEREWIVWEPDDTERINHIVSAVVSSQLDC